MRLSLRTLLAFEDNIFDVEQHRRLEQLLPTDPNAEAILGRIRSVVRNPKLGVPGLVDHQEELDPNYVAEYLDHQMPAEVQDQFESYCLSADKYLAEVASSHHILSNVLGEPARTNRECRLKCYDVLSSFNPAAETDNGSVETYEPPKHFRPFVAPEPTHVPPVKKRYFAPFWNLLFPANKGAIKQELSTTAAVEPKSPLWSFVMLGMLVSALLLGWQQIEKQRTEQKLREVIEQSALADGTPTDAVIANGTAHSDTPVEIVDPVTTFVTSEPNDTASQLVEQAKMQPIEQTAFTVEPSAEPPPAPVAVMNDEPEEIAPPITTSPVPVQAVATTPKEKLAVATPEFETQAVDPFAVAAPLPMTDAIADPFQADGVLPPVSEEEPPPATITEHSEASDSPIKAIETTPTETTEAIIAFQPIAAKHQVDQLLAKGPSERPVRSLTRSPMTATSWQTKEAVPEPPAQPPAPPIQHAHSIRPAQVHSQSVMQTAGLVPVPRILGRAVAADISQPNVIFSAVTSNSPWQLMPLPFNLQGDQYLLTATPFRGSFELASGFQIEMIGDTKLCVLPFDESGMPGIFVDYGRIIIQPLQPNLPLRIETEKSHGVVSVNGTNSALFIDTFAELSDPPGTIKPPEEQRTKTGPILGFVPKNGEEIMWKSTSQSQPFLVKTQGSVLLHSEQYRFGEIRILPNWLGTLPMPPEDRMLADKCRQCFVESGGNGEQALTRLIQNQSPSVRALGFRLWGDLGNFDVPLTMMAAKRKEDEPIRQMLVFYFQEVMRRDAETVQRFADAIAIVKEMPKKEKTN